jgi:hypothetical protein
MKKFIFVMAIVAAGIFAARGEVQGVRVDLTSQPAGVAVVVDGQDRGVTPLTMFDLRPGKHHVKCRLAGYVERDRYIEVKEGLPMQLNAVMEPEKGLLLIKSEPEGCAILIDGVSHGVTPRLITTLDTKDVYKVTLRKAGYRESVFEVKFEGRRPLVREERLVLDSGIIEVVTDPVGAGVMVNGIIRGNAPVVVSDVPKGRATVKLHMEGFKDEVRELAVNAGDRQTLSVVMEGLPGTLSLSSVPDGARFYINGEFRGKSPLVIAGMKPGDYQVKAELEGFATELRAVTIGNGSTPREEFRLSNQMGRLEVKTSPVGARVLLDGRSVGVTKSADPNADLSDALAIENVLEGEHVLTVRADGYSEVVRHPKVVSTKTLGQTIRLARIFIPDVEILTDQGPRQGVLIRNTADMITIEVKPGIEQSFPHSSVRKIEFIGPKK